MEVSGTTQSSAYRAVCAGWALCILSFLGGVVVKLRPNLATCGTVEKAICASKVQARCWGGDRVNTAGTGAGRNTCTEALLMKIHGKKSSRSSVCRCLLAKSTGMVHSSTVEDSARVLGLATRGLGLRLCLDCPFVAVVLSQLELSLSLVSLALCLPCSYL